MLFTSPIFLFLFLPIVLAGSKIASFSGPKGVGLFLLAASVCFYASWDLSSFSLLFVTISFNYCISLLLASPADSPRPSPFLSRKGLLVVALLCNLFPLLWFKYAGFFADNISYLLGEPLSFTPPSLPPGISFYTFIQIAWLVSVYRGVLRPEGFCRHALFSGFFPSILSGPIVRYEQMGPQYDTVRGPSADSLSLGFSLFSVGLAKKVLLADSLAPLASGIFSAAEKGWPLTGSEAWLGALAYTFQLYFDFSGYTDMAIGIGLMIGVQLPENFVSPYKATGIVDFWRRWHITLGLWLRDFLYIPLGGNRRGKIRQYRNLFLTMLIGGAWHGAGWTFIIWGALHGIMLAVNHFFRAKIANTVFEKPFSTWPARLLFTALTFTCLTLTWVVFRAESVEGAWRLYEVMLTGPFASAGIHDTLSGILPHHYFTSWIPFALLAVSAFIVWGLPCSHEIFSRRFDAPRSWLRFRPSRGWAIVLSLLFMASLLFLTRKTAFLYFQF
ncbi:MAG: MBOAT family protein [Desulfovibrio sp.]|nr:MBOAT family protein [Desulfovibrio sp.]